MTRSLFLLLVTSVLLHGCQPPANDDDSTAAVDDDDIGDDDDDIGDDDTSGDDDDDIGDDDDDSGDLPEPVGDWLDLSCSLGMLCARDEVGRIHCWADVQSERFTSPNSGLVEHSPVDNSACGLDETGFGSCWGPQGDDLEMPTNVALQSLQSRCALEVATGQPVCWGTTYTPFTLPGTSWDQILQSSGRLGCVRNSTEILCREYGTVPTIEVSGSYVQIAGTGNVTLCALDALGEIDCFGTGSDGSNSPPPGPWVKITGRSTGYCALAGDGAHACWGGGSVGFVAGPPDPLRDICVFAGNRACAIVDATNEILCWGNLIGQLSQFEYVP